MLQPRDHDFVALVDVLAPPTLGHQIDSFRGAAHEDYFAGRRGIQESPDLFAGGLIGICRPGSQFMRRAVHVGILMRVKVTEAVDDTLRLLGGSGIIQPHQRTSVHALPQDWKISPNDRGVKGA